MSNDVTVKLRGDDKDLNRALKDSKSAVSDYAGFVKGALVGMVATIGISKITGFGSTLISLYNTQVAAETKLQSALRATGGAAGYSLEQFKAMASEMQKTTGVGDEVILNAQGLLATFKNIRGDVFRDATMAMLDMGAIMGGDTKGAALQLGKALNDPIKGVGRLSEVGVTFTEKQKDLIKSLAESGDMMGAQRVILEELAGEFGGAASDKAKTFEGQVTSMWNRVGDLGEAIGGVLVGALSTFGPVVDTAVGFVENMIASLGNAQGVVTDFAASWSGVLVESFKWGVGIAADSFSLLEFFFTNWGNIVERTMYAAALSITTGFETLKYWMTVAAPEYLNWFADNWYNIWIDLGNFQMTVMKNMMNNAISFFSGLISWLSGGQASFEFVGLTDGFERTTKKLPEIAARIKSDTEVYLEQSVSQMDKLISDSWDGIFDKNRDFVSRMFEDQEAPEIDMTPNIAPFDEVVAKVEDKTKKAATSAAASARDAEVSTQAGRTSSLEDLSKSIQEAAMATKEFAQEDFGRGFVVDNMPDVAMQRGVDEPAAPAANNNERVVALLQEIRDFYPKLIKVSGGGLV
jgi:hypothetical protein